MSPTRSAVALALLALTFPTGRAAAALYDTRIASFATSTGICALNAVTDSSGVDSQATGPATPYYGGIGGGATTARARRGELSAHADGNVAWGGFGNQAGIMGCFTAHIRLDDVVVTGPGGMVSTRFFAEYASADTGGTSGFGERLSEGEVQLRSSGATSYPFTGSASGTGLASPFVTVTIGAPFAVEILLVGRGWGRAPDASSSAWYDFDASASFATSGPVFDLPPGYTANSADGFLVDNLYVPPVSTGIAADARAPGAVGIALAPNPFRGACDIAFELPRPAETWLRVHDVTGRLVRTLRDGTLPAGEHREAWDGNDDAGRPVAAGVYFLRLVADGRSTGKRVVRAR